MSRQTKFPRAGKCVQCSKMVPSNSALIESSETFKDLRRWRLAKSREKDVQAFKVAHDGMLRDITVYLPRDESAMKMIKGVGDEIFAKYDYHEVIDIIAHRQESNYNFVDYCDECRHFRGAEVTHSSHVATGSPPPPGPHITIHDGSDTCPTCGRGGWDGVRRDVVSGAHSARYIPSPQDFNVFTKENQDLTESQIGAARGDLVVDVEVMGATQVALSAAVDDYLQDSTVGRVFCSDDYSSPFIYSPEWVSRPLRPLDPNNPAGFWVCRFSHTRA